MANHSATEKSIRKTVARAAVNKNRRTRVRTYIKKVLTSLDSAASKEDVNKAFITAQSEIMKAVSKGLIKKNTASRKVSQLARKIKIL